MKVVAALPDSAHGRVIAHELMQSGTSVAANYRAICRSRSRKRFINKLGVAIEDADQSAFWLELIIEIGLLAANRIEPLLTEANDLIAIFEDTRKTAMMNCLIPEPMP